MIQCEDLGDESAQRPSQDAYALELERLNHSPSVVGELGDIEGRFAIRGKPDAAVVEEDDLVGRRELVDEGGVPVGARRGQAVEDQQWSPLPRRRQAIRPPSTGIVAIGSLAISDHRKPLGERQVPRVRGYQAEAW